MAIVKHVLVVSTPLYGHAIPLLQLSQWLTHSHRVTFAVSGGTLPEVRKQIKDIPAGQFGPVEFVEITSEPEKEAKFDAAVTRDGEHRERFEGVFQVVRNLFSQIPKWNGN